MKTDVMINPLRKALDTHYQTFEEWVELCNNVHDNKYTYRKPEGWEDIPLPIVEVDGYLLQGKLERIIQSLVMLPEWFTREMRLDGSRFRLDMVFYDPEESEAVAVEFDGPSHYRDPDVIARDKRKDELCKEQGIKLIRIPYWIQATTQTMHQMVGLPCYVKQDFPHGFVTAKYRPDSFCPEGYARYEKELASLPKNIREEVLLSLTKPIQKKWTGAWSE